MWQHRDSLQGNVLSPMSSQVKIQKEAGSNVCYHLGAMGDTPERYDHGHYQSNSRELERARTVVKHSGHGILQKECHHATRCRAGRPSQNGTSNKLISDANSGIFKASDKTQVWRQGLLPEAGNRNIAPGVQHLLTGGTAFADQGLIVIFHPHYEGVTMHQREDVDIKYTGELVVIGYRERTRHCFWRVLIKASKKRGKTQM